MSKVYRFDKSAHCSFRRMYEAPARLRELRADCILALSTESDIDRRLKLKKQLDDIENLLAKAERAFSALTMGGRSVYN